MNLFDYGAITEEQKKAILEVMDLAKESGNEMFAEFIKHKFKIVEPLRIDHKESEFYKVCESHGIKVWLMGYVQDKGGLDPTEPSYPIVSVTEDIRKLENLIENISK
jgi:hypothetical protein